jgi:hypothetical protein
VRPRVAFEREGDVRGHHVARLAALGGGRDLGLHVGGERAVVVEAHALEGDGLRAARLTRGVQTGDVQAGGAVRQDERAGEEREQREGESRKQTFHHAWHHA